MADYEIIGIGGPILDQVLQVTENYLYTVPGKKGGMEPVDFETLQRIIAKSGNIPQTVLGGSARNTLHGLVRLGEKCALIGMVGKDPLGAKYRHLLEAQGIIPLLLESNTPTAVVLSMVTPDGERTMRTYQGASIELKGSDLNPSLFRGIKLVHIEGYALFNQTLVEKAMQLAQDAGAKVSFDLASFEIARTFKERIYALLDQYVDIIFCNEEEAFELTGKSVEEACDELATLCEVGIILLGSRGCFLKKGTTKKHCPAYPVQPLDTTGAGDLFASGFLHAYLQGFPLEVCAHYGAIAGRAVVQIIGADIPHETWEKLSRQMKEFK